MSSTSHLDGTRTRLIEGAADLLSTEPYPAVGVKAICDRADVQKGSFYHFFASKEDLTIAALDESWDRLKTEVIEPAMAGIPDAHSRCEAIWAACTNGEEGVDGIHRDARIIGRLASSVTENEPRLRERLGAVFTEWMTMLGDDEACWASLAELQGRLVLSFALPAGVAGA